MMETIEIGKCLSEFPDGDAGKIVGLSGANGVLTTGSKVVEAGGCATITANMSGSKWYRIAIGAIGNMPSSGLFNIAHVYGTAASRGILFYTFATGYGDEQAVSKIAGSAISPISKIRLLVKAYDKKGSESILDILPAIANENTYRFAVSCLFGFALQKPTEVTNADIPAGYSVKEFVF